MDFNRLITCACIETSRAETGLSNKRISGLIIYARAIAIH